MDKDLRLYLGLVGVLCILLVLGGLTLDIIDHLKAGHC